MYLMGMMNRQGEHFEFLLVDGSFAGWRSCNISLQLTCFEKLRQLLFRLEG